MSAASRTSSAWKRGVKCRSVRRGGCAVLQRPPFRLPFLQAAVQHRHVVVAHDAEHPPRARRRVQALAVVDDDAHAVADAHLLHAAGELGRRGQHVRQRVLLVRDLVDVEEQRARNVARPGTRPSASRPAVGRCMRAVEDDEVRARRGARRASRSRPAIVAAGVLACCVVSSDCSRERDADAPVQLALVLDLGDGDAADLARAPHVRAAAGLQVHGAVLADGDEAHPARCPSAA